MKKILVILLTFLLLCGCGKSSEDIVGKFKDKIQKNNSYILKGTMTIISNEDTFTYNVTASKSKDDYYKVSLINKTNDHEQVILKNEDGVYVVTPELNKSFKFQSDWPNNGSQSYLLDVLVNDVENDTELHIDKENNTNYIQCKVNYPNNATLYSEKIYLDKDYGVNKVEVLDQDGNVKITLTVSGVNYKPSFDDDYFSLESLITEDDEETEEDKENKQNEQTNQNSQNTENTQNNENQENEETTENTSSILEDIIYPLYIPANTQLSAQDTIETSEGNRAILTFSGEKPFILVEEISKKYDYLEVIPINGDPLMLAETIGAISANSLYWTSNGVDYYISSTSLDANELMTIAESLTGTSIIVSSEK